MSKAAMDKKSRDDDKSRENKDTEIVWRRQIRGNKIQSCTNVYSELFRAAKHPRRIRLSECNLDCNHFKGKWEQIYFGIKDKSLGFCAKTAASLTVSWSFFAAAAPLQSRCTALRPKSLLFAHALLLFISEFSILAFQRQVPAVINFLEFFKSTNKYYSLSKDHLW